MSQQQQQQKQVTTLLLLAILFVLAHITNAKNNGQCKALNAVAQFRAESFYQQYLGDLQPVIAPSGAVYQSTNLQILHIQTMDMTSLELKPRNTRVLRVDMGSKATSTNIITDTLLSTMAAEEGPKTYPLVWSISNVVNVEYDLLANANGDSVSDVQDVNDEEDNTHFINSKILKTENAVDLSVDASSDASSDAAAAASSSSLVHVIAGYTASSVLKPCGEHTGYAHVLFMFFDSQTETIKNLNGTFGVHKFTYPFNQGEEKIYNENGVVLGDQPTGFEQSMVNLTDIRSVAQASQDNTVRLRVISVASIDARAKASPSFATQYVALVTTQGSTKLVRYNVKSQGHTVVSRDVVFKTILIPRVDSSDEFNFIENNNLGARIELSTDGESVFAVATLNKRQIAAFKAVHNVEVAFSESQEDAVLFIKIDIATGKVILVENLSIQLTLKTAFATSMDVKESHVLVAGNSDNFAFNGIISEAQVPFVSMVDTISGVAKTYQLPGTPKNFNANQRFVAYAGAFSLNTLVVGSTITLGGSIVRYDSPYAADGRLFLIELPSQNNTASMEDLMNVDQHNQLYNLRVGYSGSNTVTLIKRALLKVPIDTERYKIREDYLLGCIFDAPTTAPPTKKVKALKFRTAHSGLWQVDCEQENMNVRKGFVAVFYTAFSVNAAIMLVVILWNSIACGLSYRTAAIEEKKLILEGVY